MNRAMGQRSCRNFYNYVDDVIANQKYKIRSASINVRMNSGLPESVFLPSIRDPTCPNVKRGTLKESETITSKMYFSA